MKKTIFKKIAAAALALSMAGGPLLSQAAYGAEISSDLPTGISMSDVTEENFPDPHFRNWLKSLDKDIRGDSEVLDYYELGYIGSSSLDENYDVPTTDEENSKINTQFRIQWSGGSTVNGDTTEAAQIESIEGWQQMLLGREPVIELILKTQQGDGSLKGELDLSDVKIRELDIRNQPGITSVDLSNAAFLTGLNTGYLHSIDVSDSPFLGSIDVICDEITLGDKECINWLRTVGAKDVDLSGVKDLWSVQIIGAENITFGQEYKSLWYFTISGLPDESYTVPYFEADQPFSFGIGPDGSYYQRGNLKEIDLSQCSDKLDELFLGGNCLAKVDLRSVDLAQSEKYIRYENPVPKENAADLSDQSLEADYYIEDGKYKIDLKPLLKEKYWFDKVHLSLLHVEKYGASYDEENAILSYDTLEDENGDPVVPMYSLDCEDYNGDIFVLSAFFRTLHETEKPESVKLTDDATGICVEGTGLTKDMSLSVTPMTYDTEAGEAMKKFIPEGTSLFKLYDIKVMQDGEEVKIDQPLKLTVPVYEELEGTSIHVLHYDEKDKDNEYTYGVSRPSGKDGAVVKDGQVTVEVDGLSPYGLAASDKDLEDIDPDKPSLTLEKRMAIKEIEEYKDPFDYIEPELTKFNAIKETAADEINAAESKDQIDAAVDKAKKAIDALKTSEERQEDINAAKAVDDKISLIGEVSLESRLLIEDARASYDALTKEQKELVKQLDTLEAAEKKYQELKEQADKEEIDKAEAASVDKLIETIGEVTLDSGETIEAARAAYNALTDEQKVLVTGLDALKAAESKYGLLVKEQNDKKAAAEVDRLIEAVGDEITLDSREAIEAARAAYNALTDEQKVLVTGLDVLKAAESKYQELKDAADKEAAAEVDRLIEVVGDEITLDSGEAIEAARAAYNALTDSQKALVKNLDSLIKAESVYDAITEKQETENQDVHEQKGEDSHTPKTGEDQSLTPWLLMILLGGSGISLIKRRKDTDLL